MTLIEALRGAFLTSVSENGKYYLSLKYPTPTTQFSPPLDRKRSSQSGRMRKIASGAVGTTRHGQHRRRYGMLSFVAGRSTVIRCSAICCASGALSNWLKVPVSRETGVCRRRM